MNFPVGVEHKDGRMVGLVGVAFVNDVQIVVGIDRHVVSGLPGVLIRKLRKQMFTVKLEVSIANHLLGGGSFRSEDRRPHGGGESG